MPIIQITTEVKFFTVKQISVRYSLGVSTIWKWVKVGQFPQPRKMNGITRWHLEDLLTWELDQQQKAVNE